MTKTNKKAPRVNKTKEEIIARQELVQKADALRTQIKAELFPLLKEMNQSVAETKLMIEVACSAVGQAFENKKRETKIADLKLIEMLDKNGDKMSNYVKLFTYLSDKTIFDAMKMINDLPFIIDDKAKRDIGVKNINEIDLDVILG